MITKFKITNITCESCIKLSNEVLKDLPGVSKVVITKDGLSQIESTKEISAEEIKNALAEVGKTAIIIE